MKEFREPHWIALTDAFHTASITGTGWQAALTGVAAATGSRAAQLIGIGPASDVQFNFFTGLDPGIREAYVAGGYSDPAVNPRVRIALETPTLSTVAESDFLTPHGHRDDRHYREFAAPWDIPFSCLSPLGRYHGVLAVLAVFRSHGQGHISSVERERFTQMAPHAKAAVAARSVLEGQGSLLLTGAFEALSIAAFVCDRAGQVAALTPAAERIAERASHVTVRHGQLVAARDAQAPGLQAAIAAAVARTGAILTTVVVMNRARDVQPLVLDVIALPSVPHELAFNPRVLVVARGSSRSPGETAALLRHAYGLSASEADIAVRLAAGADVAEIAVARGVTVSTIRSQIKSVLAKAGVRRQLELVAQVNRL